MFFSGCPAEGISSLPSNWCGAELVTVHQLVKLLLSRKEIAGRLLSRMCSRSLPLLIVHGYSDIVVIK